MSPSSGAGAALTAPTLLVTVFGAAAAAGATRAVPNRVVPMRAVPVAGLGVVEGLGGAAGAALGVGGAAAAALGALGPLRKELCG